MRYSLINPVNPAYKAHEQIFINRGFKYEDIDKYLNTTSEDILPPASIENLLDGIKKLYYNLKKENDIYIQVDSDVDGVTSAAMLINYLYCRYPIFCQTHLHYGLHDTRQHGILVDKIPKDVKLVIVPDASSNEYDIHQKLQEKGIDVIIIDHHEAPKVSEYACVINNQLCNYPNKNLSGAGMVYKFCCGIDELHEDNLADNFLDLAAVGIIADMVDLRDLETRQIIKEGIENIKNPFINQMCHENAFSLKGEVTPIGIAFYIAPYINAVLRSGTPAEKEILFQSFLNHLARQEVLSTKRGHSPNEMEQLVVQSCRNSKNIRNRQNKSKANSLAIVESLIKEHLLYNNKILVVMCENPIDTNLTGLLANQIVPLYQKPIFILNKKEKGEWHGSARGYEKSELKHFKSFCSEFPKILFAEGHQNAFGIGFKNTEDVKEFIEWSNEKLSNVSFDASYGVDFIYNFGNFNSNDILKIAELKSLCGKNIEEALIAVEAIKITSDNLKLMGKESNPTLKIILPNGVSLIKFKSSQEEFDALYSDNGCTTVNVVGRCEKNEWNGNVTPQIIIEDYEIVTKENYYF